MVLTIGKIGVTKAGVKYSASKDARLEQINPKATILYDIHECAFLLVSTFSIFLSTLSGNMLIFLIALLIYACPLLKAFLI